MILKKVFPCLLAAGFLMLSAPNVPRKMIALDQGEMLEELRATPVEEIAKRSSYDSRSYGIVTSVKDQSPTLLCWSYASLAAAETSILREGIDPKFNKDNLDLEEFEAAKASCGKFLDPLELADGDDANPSDWNKGGYIDFITRISSRWQGIVQTGNEYSAPKRQYSEFILENAIKCNNDVDEIKMLVAAYGGVAFEYQEGYGDYHISTGGISHVSEIVGWDDGIKKENFTDGSGNVLAKHDGAWLVKNSWGTQRNSGGYFWLSYDSVLQDITAFDFGLRRDNALLYNYAGNNTSGMYWTSTSTRAQTSIAYTFSPKANCDETLESVMVGVSGKDVKVRIDVYDSLSASTPCDSEEFETHSLLQSVCTLQLENPVKLKKNTDFCVVATVKNGGFLLDFHGDTGNAKCYTGSGSSWSKLSLGDGQLPVVHPITEVAPENRETDYSKELYEKIRVFDKAVKQLPDTGMTAENFEGLSSIKKALDKIGEIDRSELWLTDEIRISRYQDYVESWSKLVQKAEKAIEFGKKIF